MSIATSLAGYFDELLEDVATVQQGHLAQAIDGPRVWFDQSGQEAQILLTGETGLIDTTFDVEIIGDTKKITDDIAILIKTALHGFNGTLEATPIQYAEVTDHKGDYRPKGAMEGDEGRLMTALQLTFIHNQF